MKVPLKLSYGDTIGFFSPSAPATCFAKERYLRAVNYLESKGFKLIAGKLTEKIDFYRSGTIKERAEELNELIRNPEVKCIISTIGGMNSNSLLPYIDYEAFSKNPKILIGYSDITAILLAVYEMTGITTYYGPALVASFGEFSPFVDMTYEAFSNILVAAPKYPIELSCPPVWTDEYIDWNKQKGSKTEYQNDGWITVNSGIVEGRLIGGNLNTLEGIWGTKYMPEIKQGDILFIEDSLKTAAIIERSFALLKNSGTYKLLGGLILGKHEQFDDCQSGRKPYEILLEVVGDELTFPVLADFDCAHTHPMLTLPIGGKVRLDASKKEVIILNEEMI